MISSITHRWCALGFVRPYFSGNFMDLVLFIDIYRVWMAEATHIIRGLLAIHVDINGKLSTGVF